MSFVDWLTDRIRESGLSYSEIGRRGGISHVRISQVLNGESPGATFCLAISRGLNLPPEEVFRKAGLLPSLPAPVAEEREIIRIVRTLPERLRESALAMVRGLAGVPSRQWQAEDHQPDNIKELAAYKLAVRLEQLSPEHREQVIRFMDRLTTHGEKTDPAPLLEKIV